MQPVQIIIERAIGSSFVIAKDFFGELFAVEFMLVIGVLVGRGVATDQPHKQRDDGGQDG